MTTKDVERRAQSLLAKTWKPPIPVDLIAEKLGLTIEPTALGDDISGVLVVGANAGVIGVNQDQPYVRQRFTIAHEIGHFVLHRSHERLFIDKQYTAYFRDAESSKGTRAIEREANAFAAALLMPRNLVERFAKPYTFDLGDEGGPIEELAETFRVSSQAMTYRLVNLGVLSSAAPEHAR